jgi:hypothetical protein
MQKFRKVGLDVRVWCAVPALAIMFAFTTAAVSGPGA